MKRIRPAPDGKKFRLPRKQKKRMYKVSGGRIVYMLLRHDFVGRFFKENEKLAEEMRESWRNFIVTGKYEIKFPVEEYTWKLQGPDGKIEFYCQE